MMQYPIHLGTLALVLAGLLITSICPSNLEARIGERRESLERRLFGSGGIVYRDDEIESARSRGMPYMRFFEYMSGSADVRIYFKTADGRRPSSSELDGKRMSAGWDLHVVYISGKSAIEVYKRSQGITEYEFNQLLATQAAGSFWKKVTKQEMAETVSAFGFDMVRDDGRVRAKKLGGDSLMVFEAEIDIALAEMNTSALLEKAPVSVEGF